ncbi:putative FBD domain, leucine-rich repeat domain, L domain-containing protein [Medicago truncatula]|uniref:Putative FBD domain, leucine-rich repeat domain, L domain-containing protein n=1 Tax=Medicago truncatula TaxID=3880 RepID=A0A396GQ43_MEDTR|nr:F-box/FBD/LRR-repeat protein At4g26340-like [Medicago truncatula]RHN40797.1 putative FBD domain, leucine-rich repeat domain, L domain-containing protein [Medicago truncatula]
MTLDCAHSTRDDYQFREYSVDNWVRAAIGPHLQELNLTLMADFDGSDFNLPKSLFTSANLISLSLCGEICVNIQHSTVISLPSLKMLLINIGHMEVPSINALLCGCPNIESLNLGFSPQSLDKVCIPPPLKRLKITVANVVGAYLEINAPNLEYLNITGITFGQVFTMYNLHNVVEAYLDVFPQSLGSVVALHNLLGALSGTKHLVLSHSTTQWLLGEPHNLLFQEFHYLIRLELILLWFNSNSLLSLLQKCPMLQVLIIQNDKQQLPILGWAPQTRVPDCLVSHLTFIQFKGLRGFPDEVSFVEYVLQNGLVLKTMIIAVRSLDLEKKYSVVKTLSNAPRASTTCQLTFD